MAVDRVVRSLAKQIGRINTEMAAAIVNKRRKMSNAISVNSTAISKTNVQTIFRLNIIKINAFSAVFLNGQFNHSDWYVDSGASVHLTALLM